MAEAGDLGGRRRVDSRRRREGNGWRGSRQEALKQTGTAIDNLYSLEPSAHRGGEKYRKFCRQRGVAIANGERIRDF